MQNSFEKWRQQQMSSVASADSLMRFHKVDAFVYLEVEKFLKRFVLDYVDKQKTVFRVKITPNMLNTLFLFLNQMRWAYVHPRSTSARVLFHNMMLADAQNNDKTVC